MAFKATLLSSSTIMTSRIARLRRDGSRVVQSVSYQRLCDSSSAQVVRVIQHSAVQRFRIEILVEIDSTNGPHLVSMTHCQWVTHHTILELEANQSKE